MRVLVVNAGSSSLKVSVVDRNDRILADQELESPDGRLDEAGLGKAVRGMDGIDAVGHRVVHGGARFQASVQIDAEVVRYLGTITDLAPLHLPAALAAIEAVAGLLPNMPAVACFDTAFHSHVPEAASTYAIPREWRERYGIKRYGFHGFSHAYASRRAAAILGRLERALKVVTCHLGAGASLAAVAGGQSVDTTMGFTPLEGLVMATRSGTVDPGALLYLMRHADMSEPELTDGLDRKGGLLALAGTSDMREVLRRMGEGDGQAQLAFDVFGHRLRAEIGSMAASLNGPDALVFTGGIGQNSPEVRSAVAGGLGFLGVAIDEATNSTIDGDGDVSTAEARVRTLVVHAREDVEVAREVRRVLAQTA
ncbi:MAG TPA: acetate/propionate family kinase [Candidatus Dormibacteraeota bacterium]|nr:acetate/propionate family kinase [Candidatus Dormibacteraeota bacterium]HEV2476066.1 acetate/propionate family kinase [Candidatus Dormibacteraeota bacterium]